MVFVEYWKLYDCVRIVQNRVFRPELDVGGKNRKEIELSVQKIKIGILPTENSGLKTPLGLRSQTSGWGRKSAVFPSGWPFTFATGAYKTKIYDRKVYKNSQKLH